jgi:hypothetical protein
LIIDSLCVVSFRYDQKETEHNEYQLSKGNNTMTINDQKETGEKDYQ